MLNNSISLSKTSVKCTTLRLLKNVDIAIEINSNGKYTKSVDFRSSYNSRNFSCLVFYPVFLEFAINSWRFITSFPHSNRIIGRWNSSSLSLLWLCVPIIFPFLDSRVVGHANSARKLSPRLKATPEKFRKSDYQDTREVRICILR